MRALLYVGGWLLLAVSALAMALLPRLTPSAFRFMLGGAVLTGMLLTGWLLLSATAAGWYRPRAGQALAVAGALGVMFAWWDRQWLALGWGGMVLLTGLGLLAGHRLTARSQAAKPRPRQVQPPLGRRESL
jgi:hypothetical protein